MFVFGHLGIGNKLASPWSRRLPKFPLFLGMLLPDLIDKVLYYGGLFPEWVTCTRTFGHTAVFLIAVLIVARLARSNWLSALALGIATHLLLDCLLDRFDPTVISGTQPSSALVALTWPVMSSHFSTYHFDSIKDHLLHHLTNVPILCAETVGLALLGWDYWKSAYRGEITRVLFSRRWRKLKRHRLERD
jgi:hypothetical protein